MQLETLSVPITLESDKFQKGIALAGKALVVFAEMAVAAAAVKLYHLAEQVGDTNSALGRFAENMGLSVESVSAWGRAAYAAGGSAQGLQKVLNMINESQSQMLSGETPQFFKEFTQLGNVPLFNGTEQLKSVDVLVDIAERLHNLQNRQKAYSMALSITGGDEALATKMLEGGKAMRDAYDIAAKGALTQSQSDEAKKIQESFRKLSLAFETLENIVIGKLSPSLIGFNDVLKSILNLFGDSITDKRPWYTQIENKMHDWAQSYAADNTDLSSLDARKKYIKNFYYEKAIIDKATPEQAEMIANAELGNHLRETGDLNPLAKSISNGHTYLGIGQWNEDRQKNYESMWGSNIEKDNSLIHQLIFGLSEQRTMGDKKSKESVWDMLFRDWKDSKQSNLDLFNYWEVAKKGQGYEQIGENYAKEASQVKIENLTIQSSGNIDYDSFTRMLTNSVTVTNAINGLQ